MSQMRYTVCYVTIFKTKQCETETHVMAMTRYNRHATIELFGQNYYP